MALIRKTVNNSLEVHQETNYDWFLKHLHATNWTKIQSSQTLTFCLLEREKYCVFVVFFKWCDF